MSLIDLITSPFNKLKFLLRDVSETSWIIAGDLNSKRVLSLLVLSCPRKSTGNSMSII